MLYDFSKLSKKLDELGFPKVESNEGFQVVRTDFQEAYRANQIEFREDGIYYLRDGREFRGYMYMPTYRISHYDRFPSFHIVKCSVIDDFVSKGVFNSFYIWSNSNKNDILDRDTKKNHKDEVLKLCSRCRSTVYDEISNTQDFFDTLDTEDIQSNTNEVDIFGYDRNWRNISKQYKESVNHTCESCSIEINTSADRRYLHTHHINGDKTNNRITNLQCLCALCHANVDEHHKENFEIQRLKIELKTFVTKFHKELEGNPFIDLYDDDGERL